MATVGNEKNVVFVVIDVHKAVLKNAWHADEVIANISRALEKARTAGIPVLWIKHSSDEMPRNSDGWQLVDGLSPLEGERIIHKRNESSFEDTDFAEALAEHDCGHIVISGAATNWCVRATAYGALDRGYDITLVKDAHSTKNIELPDGKVIDAGGIITDLNIVMTYLSYPGRKTGTVSSTDLDFEKLVV
ncbi:MAG: isochorismatase family protein [Emcibacteraceae bacterium]